MARLVARYLLLSAAVVLLNFALPRLLPGDPLDATSPGGLDAAAPALTAQERAELRAYYPFDRPMATQFVAYLGDLARGDLGWSISRSAPVRQLILERLPWTLGLVLGATIIAGMFGTALGMAAAWRGGWTDRLIVGGSSALAAIPELLVAMALLLALSSGLGWFPLQGGRTPFAPAAIGVVGLLGVAADVAWHVALPAATLVIAGAAAFVLLARGAVGAVLPAPYLATARAKGLSEWRVAVGHAAPNALVPVLTLSGVRVGQILGGAIVVERIFSVPGLGLLTYQAIGARDYPVLQAVFLLGSLGVLAANFAVELTYRRLDPRRGT